MDCKRLATIHKEMSNEDKKKIREIAKKVLSFLAHHNLSPTPRNYDEWFYVVCKAMDEKQLLTDNNLKILYEKYFKTVPYFHDIEEIKEISHNLKSLTDGSHKALDTFETNIQTHNTYIHESMEALEEQDREKVVQLQEKIALLEKENERLKKFIEKNRKRLAWIEEKFQEQKKEIELDALTGISNRRSFDKDVEYLDLNNIPYGLIILDVDNFKKINDTYGHLIGDEVLKTIGEILHTYVRNDTKSYRYGGEEFVVVLPHADKEGVRIVAERLREVIEHRGLNIDDKGGFLHFTASFGATVKKEGETIQDVLKRADEALYEAKRTGKNRVIMK